MIGQVGERLVVEIDHLGEVHGRGRHLLVLAELPIRGQQIGKIDAAERLALAGTRLRVVHRDRDQLVEFDVLDVEDLAHMRAARAQQLRNNTLIGHPVKPRRNRLRRRRHLTKRKRGGKNLDEERFHPDPTPTNPKCSGKFWETLRVPITTKYSLKRSHRDGVARSQETCAH